MPLIKSNETNPRGLGSDFLLRFGDNDVPASVWAKWEDHPHIVALIDSGDLEVTASKRSRKPKTDDAPPTDDEIAAAIKGATKLGQ